MLILYFFLSSFPRLNQNYLNLDCTIKATIFSHIGVTNADPNFKFCHCAHVIYQPDKHTSFCSDQTFCHGYFVGQILQSDGDLIFFSPESLVVSVSKRVKTISLKGPYKGAVKCNLPKADYVLGLVLSNLVSSEGRHSKCIEGHSLGYK